MKVTFTINNTRTTVNRFFPTHIIRKGGKGFIVSIFLHIGYGSEEKGGVTMKDLLMLLGFVAFWIMLQKYILPRLGVPT
jgi:hypothetical protein